MPPVQPSFAARCRRRCAPVVPWVVALFFALAVTVRGGANLSVFLLFLLSIAWWGLRGDSADARNWCIILSLPFVLAALQIAGGFALGARVLDAPSRFVFAAICLFMLPHLSSQALGRALGGVIIGALGVGVWGWLSTHVPEFMWFDGQRAWNGFSNPIPFGLMSVMLGFFALLLPQSLFPRLASHWFWLLKIVAFVATLYAAAMTQSRVVLLVFPWCCFVILLSYHRWSWGKTLGSFVLVCAVLAAVVMGSDNRLRDRVMDGVHDIQVYEQNYSTSMGLRWRLWTDAVEIVKENPWFGIGKSAYTDEMRRRYAEGLVPHELRASPHPHNEYLNFAVEFGVLGVVLALLFYGYPLQFFMRHLRHHDELIRCAACYGGILCGGFALAGCLDTYFWIVSQTTFYGLGSVIFMSLILARERELQVAS